MKITCPNCANVKELPDDVAGKRVRCAKCQTVIRVPDAESPKPEAPGDEPPRRPKAPPPVPRERAPQPRRGRDEDDRRERSAPKKQSGSPLLLVLALFAVFGMLAVAGGVGYYLYTNKKPDAPIGPAVTGPVGMSPPTKQSPNSAAELRAALIGTEWTWGRALVFKQDGYVIQENWDSRGLVTRWQAIDRRTVILVIERGRDHDKFAILQFSDDLGQFTGYDFVGAKLEDKKRVGGPVNPLPVVEVNDELKRELTDTVWEWAGDMKLKADGYAAQKHWTDDLKLATRWQAIDRRTVLLRIESGRDTDRLAVLQFSEDLKTFAGFDFKNEMPPKARAANMVPTDLTPYGLRATIDLPAGAEVKGPDPDDGIALIKIDRDRTYNLRIRTPPFHKRDEIWSKYANGTGGEKKARAFPVNDPDMLMIEEADGGFTLFRWVNFGGEHYEIEKALSLNKTDRPAVDLMYRSAKSLRETPEQKAANDRMAAALSAFTKAGGRLQHQGLRIARIENEQPGPALDALKDMWIDYVEISSPDTTAKDIEKLANIPTMTRLWLSRSAITDEVFAPVGKLTKLRSIGFTRTVMTDDGLKSLAGLKELRKLNLSGDSTRATPASLSVLANLTNLEELSLSKWELTDASLQSISGLKKLKKLTFFGSNVNDAGLAHLKGMTALNELNLEESKVTNAGLAHLSGLTNLKQLTLRDTAITDAGLTHLKNLKSLEHLRLDGTKVTEKGIPDLYGLTNLKTLYFTKASKKALDELWEKIPKVTVYAD